MSKKLRKIRPLAAIARGYASLLTDIKQRIRTAQVRTAMAGNASMLMLYLEIGSVLVVRQQKEGWGTAVLPRLATDLHNDLPEVKGFSHRNLKRMVQFFASIPRFLQLGHQRSAQLEIRPCRNAKRATACGPIGHRTRQCPNLATGGCQIAVGPQRDPHRENQKTCPRASGMPNRLSRRAGVATSFPSNPERRHERQGKAITNFAATLPSPQSDLAAQLLKDPYLFDFLTLEKPFHERELETGLLRHLQDFLVELGAGLPSSAGSAHGSGRRRLLSRSPFLPPPSSAASSSLI